MIGPAVRAEAPGPGVRVIARHVSELLLARSRDWQAALALDRVDSLLVLVILSANLAPWPPAPEGVDLPDDRRRPVSLLAVAQSMGLAYETVRRRCHDLAARGVIAIGEGGCVVPAALLRPPAAAALLAGDAAALAAMFERMGEHRLAMQARAARPAVVARLLIDLSVRVMEPIVANYGSVVAGSVFVAIVAANVRPLLAAPDLSARFAREEDVPPDSLRQPVGLRAVARELGLPYETVRRQGKALVERGLVETVAGGVLVPARVLMNAPQRAANRAIQSHYWRLCADLAQVAAAPGKP